MSAAISLKGVVKRFGKFAAIDHLDLEIPHGMTFGLLVRTAPARPRRSG